MNTAAHEFKKGEWVKFHELTHCSIDISFSGCHLRVYSRRVFQGKFMTSGMRRLTVLLLLLLGSILCTANQVAVVVDKANATGELTVAELTKILKGENHRWPDGKLVTVVLRDVSTPEMHTALQKIYKTSPEELKALIAAHKGSFVVANTDEELLKLVSGTPGAIGLIDVYSITNRVSVLKVEGKLPLQPGYVLKSN